MIRAPGFWHRDGVLPALLSPLGGLYAAATARRVARPGWHAPVPVICVGNASAGGTGKTPVALDIATRLIRAGRTPHFLSRGYRGTARAITRVEAAQHDAAMVGDEALLLAALAPTWTGADRAASARAAIAAGADGLIMDDGLQNPALHKTLSLLVIDGATGFGNGRVIPAGPLREPVAACARRVQAAILIGPDRTGATASLPPGLPILRAAIRPGPEIEALRGKPILAFAGIGRPEKFFTMLEEAGLTLVARHAFPDHHRFSATELKHLAGSAATPVCTPKDFVRIPQQARAAFTPIGMSLAWQDAPALDTLLQQAFA